MAETVRYDAEEDRANDVVTHDNPNHDSGHTNEVNLDEADRQIAENLTYPQIQELIADMFVSWQFIRMNLAEGELKVFHQKRFGHLRQVLEPYWNEIKLNETKKQVIEIPVIVV